MSDQQPRSEAGEKSRSREANDERAGRSDPDREAEEQPKQGEDAAQEKDRDSGAKKKKRHKPSKKFFIIGGIVLALLIVGGVIYYLHARHFESTDDAYIAGHVHEISARVAGTVAQVRVDDNEIVHRGQLLLVLDPTNFELGREKARAQLAQAQAQVTQAQAQVAQREAATQRAAANLEKAQNDFTRVTSLYQQDAKAVSKADVDTATAALHSAQSESTAAQADTAAAHAQLGVAHAGVTAAQAALHDAELQLSYTQVVAPVDGKVGKKTVETGQRIQPGQALMAVVGNDVWVSANLKETQLAQVRIGQKVTIKVDAIPDHEFIGHIDSFQPGSGATFALLPPDNATGNFTKIVQRVPVKIVFDPKSLRGYEKRIFPGLSAQPTIDLRTR